MRMTMHLKTLSLGLVAGLLVSSAALAEGIDTKRLHPKDEKFSFEGPFGTYDRGALQRGFQVYKEVCSACHGLSRVHFRNLSEPGGPGFPEEAVKQLAAEWPNQIPEPNDAGEVAKGGDLIKRPAKPFDSILGPYLNEKQARAAQNGALPPDLSVIAKARGVHREVSWYVHPFLMLGDIIKGYQEGGPDYLVGLLTGYKDAPPEGVTIPEGKYYNTAFPGNAISMPPPLSDGVVTYQDGSPQTAEQYAHDVTAFLAWAADPSLDQRKRIGWQVMLYLLVTTVLLYLGKRRVWAKMH